MVQMLQAMGGHQCSSHSDENVLLLRASGSFGPCISNTGDAGRTGGTVPDARVCARLGLVTGIYQLHNKEQLALKQEEMAISLWLCRKPTWLVKRKCNLRLRAWGEDNLTALGVIQHWSQHLRRHVHTYFQEVLSKQVVL
uniref:Uncharacterized protein n=1 Tax=Arundo donax TaxID=35708 RepID=A0A0A9CFW9_ARUDO